MEGLKSIVVGWISPIVPEQRSLTRSEWLPGWVQVHPVHVVDTLIDEIREDAALDEMQRGIHVGLIEDARKRWDSFIEGIPEASRLQLEVSVAHRLVGIRHQLDRHSADLLVLGAMATRGPRWAWGRWPPLAFVASRPMS